MNLKKISLHFTIGLWPFWLAIPLPLALLVLILWFGFDQGTSTWNDVHFKIFSMVMQLAGLGNIAWGLHSIRKKYDEKSLLRRARCWLTETFELLTEPTTVYKEDIVECAVGTATATGTKAKIIAHMTFEERLTDLEVKINTIQLAIKDNRETANKKLSELDYRVTNEFSRLTDDVKKVDSKLNELSTGGLVLETVGLIWLTFGTITGAFPEWFACKALQLFIIIFHTT